MFCPSPTIFWLRCWVAGVRQSAWRRAFCKKTGLDEKLLERVLLGNADLPVATLSEALERIGYKVDLAPATPQKRSLGATVGSGLAAAARALIRITSRIFGNVASRGGTALKDFRARADHSRWRAYASRGPGSGPPGALESSRRGCLHRYGDDFETA